MVLPSPLEDFYFFCQHSLHCKLNTGGIHEVHCSQDSRR
nr:MAG TPA: hypothetical protein [Caudoviricetes sp.]